MNPKRIRHRCPIAVTFRAAKLHDYKNVERLYTDIEFEFGA